MQLHTKAQIASARGVSHRTVDNWVDRKLLPPPMKLGTTPQARVRWTDKAVATLDANLAKLNQGPRAA